MEKKILIFDVESTSLYGEALAVGAIVADKKGNIIEEFALMATDLLENSNEWVKQNVLPFLTDLPTCKTGFELRTAFYNWYIKFADTCVIWSDVNYPVETNFLNSIVKDDINGRQGKMPFPLYDVANFVQIDVDRIKTSNVPDLKKHNPLDDAKASYFCLIKYIKSEKLEKHFNKILSYGE